MLNSTMLCIKNMLPISVKSQLIMWTAVSRKMIQEPGLQLKKKKKVYLSIFSLIYLFCIIKVWNFKMSSSGRLHFPGGNDMLWLVVFTSSLWGVIREVTGMICWKWEWLKHLHWYFTLNGHSLKRMTTLIQQYRYLKFTVTALIFSELLISR